MFQRLFSRFFPGRRPVRTIRYRLALEQLEDRRLLSAVSAVSALQSQALVAPTIDGTGATLQYIPVQNYTTVASETVTVTGSQTGLFQLSFQAQAWSPTLNRVGVRYLIDSQFDPNDAVIRSGTGADVIEDVGTSAWQTLYLTRLINLSAGTHTIIVQVYGTSEYFTPLNSFSLYAPVLSVVAYNIVDTAAAAAGTQVQALTSPIAGNSNQQVVTSGTWQTVTSASVTVGANKTGLFDLTFQAIANDTLNTRVQVRYLIDGQLDPRDVAVSSAGNGADVTEDFIEGGSGQWHTLLLSHQLTLSVGTHTVAIQIMTTTLINADAGPLTVYTPVLSLVGYNTIDAQHSADGLQSQTPVGGAGPVDVTAGAWQTVATLSVPVAGIRSGLYALGFQAQAQSDGANRVYLQYLIDGKVDPNDVGITQSASEADAVEDFSSGTDTGTWHTLSLMRMLNLTPGTHTITVQVWAAQQADSGPDLVVAAPVLHVTGFNNITPAGSTGGTGGTGGTGSTGNPNSTFYYNGTTGVLTINGTAGNDSFKFSQVTHAAAVTGALTTSYTFTLNNASVTYTSAQLTGVVVNGNGGTDTATLTTSDTYRGIDGFMHETLEQALLGPGGGILQKFDAGGNPFTFMQLLHFSKISAFMGSADSAQLTGSSAVVNTFVSAGLTSYMSGTGYYDYVSGAPSVTATSANPAHDFAYQYDGSGASTYTAQGVTSSTMTGLDKGLRFANTAVGFHFNTGIARHSGDVANLYAAPGTDIFVGQKTEAYIYAYTGKVQTMNDLASGFGHVYAFGSAGGNDGSYNYAPTINTVTGFKRIVG
jgi:hypothetical protein